MIMATTLSCFSMMFETPTYRVMENFLLQVICLYIKWKKLEFLIPSFKNNKYYTILFSQNTKVASLQT